MFSFQVFGFLIVSYSKEPGLAAMQADVQFWCLLQTDNVLTSKCPPVLKFKPVFIMLITSASTANCFKLLLRPSSVLRHLIADLVWRSRSQAARKLRSLFSFPFFHIVPWWQRSCDDPIDYPWRPTTCLNKVIQNLYKIEGVGSNLALALIKRKERRMDQCQLGEMPGSHGG